MFGYIQICRPELKVKDYEKYRSYYCGLCHVLHQRYGRRGQVLLNYDMTFLKILLLGLYEPALETDRKRCVPHPMQRHEMSVSEAVDQYAADMTVLLAFAKAQDDIEDEKKPSALLLRRLLLQDYLRIREEYPRQTRVLIESLHKLRKCERGDDHDLDRVAGCTGRFLSEIYNWKDDVWSADLKQMGYYLGKFICLMDALDDREDDLKKGRYNLLQPLYEQSPDTFEDTVKDILTDTMSHAARAFERLPVLENAQILRNMIYAGVWSRYAAVTKKSRTGGTKDKQESEHV